MQKNVGGIDRIARLVLGPVLVALGVLSSLGYAFPVDDTAGYAVAGFVVLVGLVFVATGAVQRCALNELTGTDTAAERTRSTASDPDQAGDT